MMRMLIFVPVILCVLAHAFVDSCQAADSLLLVGMRIDDLKLHDHLGTERRLRDWSDQQVVVVAFLGTECPLAKLYAPKLVELAKKYADRGVQFVGINSNQQDSLRKIAHYVRTHEIPFPILKDPDNEVADQFQATRTPVVYLLDRTRTIRYRGRIDDQYGQGYTRAKVTRDDLAIALDEVLASKPVSVPVTKEVGCHIARVPRKSPTGEVTYSNHVAPVLQQHCVRCHRDGQIAPFSLTSYDDARAWSASIREAIEEQRMPPWHANPKYGHFANDASLSLSDKRLLFEWIENGMPEGNPSDLPAPVAFNDGWQLPRHDVIYKMPKAFDVPATGVVPYQYFEVDAKFDEDVWIQGAEIRPGNAAVVHHVFAFYIPPGQKKLASEDPLLNAIAAFAPGMPAELLPEGHAQLIPAGSSLYFQVHYTPNGSRQSDQSEVGIVFADPKSVKKEVTLGIAANVDFRIPPGAAKFVVPAGYEFTQETLLHALVPHMHYRGKAFRFTAEYPDGKKEILLDVPRYDFRWQNVYILRDVKSMPKGTVLMCHGVFDNSAANLDNPDPTREVRWGDQTFEEMMLGTFVTSLPDSAKPGEFPKVTVSDEGKCDVAFRFRPEANQNVSKSVFLAGSFNDWKPNRDQLIGPDQDGNYHVSLRLNPGRYEYKFVVDENQWTYDAGNPDRRGPFSNSVVRVRSQQK